MGATMFLSVAVVVAVTESSKLSRDDKCCLCKTVLAIQP